MTTRIELRAMRFYAYHGVTEQEQSIGNTFLIDLTLTAPLEKAVQSDDLNDTISYTAVYEIVKAEMAIPSKLLEHVAGRILNALKKQFPTITKISLMVSKLNPPFGGDVHSAAIHVEESYPRLTHPTY